MLLGRLVLTIFFVQLILQERSETLFHEASEGTVRHSLTNERPPSSQNHNQRTTAPCKVPVQLVMFVGVIYFVSGSQRGLVLNCYLSF